MYKNLMGGKEDGARFISVAPTGRTRGNGHKFKKILLSEEEKTFIFFFYCEGGETQVAESAES